MSQRSLTQTPAKPSFTPIQAGLLQRKCASCGQHTIAGRECVGCTKKKSGLQRKLTIGASNDSLEQEADRVADQVMAASAYPAISGALPSIQRYAEQAIGQADMSAPASVDRVLANSGRPLEPSLQADIGQRFGHDFSRVRVHTGGAAEQSAREVNANAYTVGHDIVFGTGRFEPETHRGQRLLAHELAHVVQQSDVNATHANRGDPLSKSVGSAAGRGSMVQRAIKPEDVAVEMSGREFELAVPFTSGPFPLVKGTHVTILTWVNADTTVVALAPAMMGPVLTPLPMIIPKTLLRPVRPSGTKLDPYTTGLDAQVKAVEKNEADLVGKTGSEKTRIEGLLTTRREVLNRKLIQETMFNRFDPIIASEVTAANAAHSLTGPAALDPDLVKAMIFQESEMGTSGTHMEIPPSHPVKSRFNLGQVIDSSGMALLTMLEREQPAVITTFFLTNLRSDLAAVKTEKTTLEAMLKKKALSPTQAARLAELKRLSLASWETFIWEYKAPGKMTGFEAAVTGFFASSAPVKNMDYAFWIHMMVLWLFEKKTPSRTWLETIKAYNGSGKRAEHYRDTVAKRATDANVAATAGIPFTPTR